MDGQILPAVLVKKFSDIESEVLRLKNISKRVQLDICDGEFIPSKTWPLNEVSFKDFANLGSGEPKDLYLPFWEKVDYTADLMAVNPKDWIKPLMKYGVDDVVIHFRSLPEGDRKNYFNEIVDLCEEYEMSLNLAVDLKTNLQEFLKFIKHFANNLNYVQVMGIENVGKQGESFCPLILEVISEIKKFFTEQQIDLPIFVDGGMNEKSIPLCKERGAEVFVVGSALSKAVDYKEEFEFLNSL